MPELAASTSSPRVELPGPKHSDSMRLATGHFFDFVSFEILDHLGLWLIRAAVFVLWHALGVGMTKLAAATTTPRVESALLSKGYGVGIATGYLDDFDSLKQLNESGRGLIRIAFDIGRQVSHALKAKLSAGTGSPRVDIASDINSNGVAVSSSNLVDAFVTEPQDLERVGLERIPFAVFWHLGNDFT